MGVFCSGLNLILQQPSTAVLAKTKADIAKKSSYSYSFRCMTSRVHKLPVYSCSTSFFLSLKFITKYYSNKKLLGVKLHNKFKILCNNDWARASSPSSPAQLKTWVDPWNIWLADFRMGSWPCLTLLSLSIRSNCKLFLENYRSAESGASRIPLLLFNCSCKAVERLGTM